MTRGKRLATFGPRGNLVRLFEVSRNGSKYYTVQWGPKGQRAQESFPHTKEGKAEAEAFFKAFKDEREAASRGEQKPLTNRELWTAYITDQAPHLRHRSIQLYTADWRTWEQFAGRETIAAETSVAQIGEFRKSLEARKLSTASVYGAIRNIRIVFNWGERMELLARNRWHLYVHKVAKDRRTKPRAEYRADEFMAIWRSLSPEKSSQWRPWVAIGLLGIYGNRQNEILNLQWSWVTGDDVRVPRELVKTGEENVLSLFPQTRHILDVARSWRERGGYTGDYVIFPARAHSKEPHYTIQSLTKALHAAERRVGIEPIRWRAGHGFRRGLMGDLVDATGDVTLALQALGDRDLSMATHYRVRRNDRVNTAVRGRAERLLATDADGSATKVQPHDTENEERPEIGPLTSSTDT